MFTMTVPADLRILAIQDIESAIEWRRPLVTGEPVWVGPDRDIAVFVGITPAGCIWVTREPAKLDEQRRAMGRLWSRTKRPMVEGAVLDFGTTDDAEEALS